MRAQAPFTIGRASGSRTSTLIVWLTRLTLSVLALPCVPLFAGTQELDSVTEAADDLLGESDLAIFAANLGTPGALSEIVEWSRIDGYGDKFADFGRPPFSASSRFDTLSGFAAGGPSCSVWMGRSESVVECKAGECGHPVMGWLKGGAQHRIIAADDRDVFGFAAAGPRAIYAERYDTTNGSRQLFTIDLTASSGIPADLVPDIHAAFRNGANWDVILRTFNPANSQQRGYVLRMNRNGTIVQQFSLPSNVVPLGAALTPIGVALQESRGGAYGIGMYQSSDYAYLNQLVAPGAVSNQRVAVGYSRSRVFAYRPNNLVGIWNLHTGVDEGNVAPPQGTNFISHFASSPCQLDTTKASIGPRRVLELSGTVRDQQGNQFPIRFAPNSSDQAVEGYFFDANNREGLIKALDACGFTGTYWLYGGFATDLAFTLTVRNRETGQVESFSNPAGNPASSIANTSLFRCSN